MGFKGIKPLNEHNVLYLRVQLNRYDVGIELQDYGSSYDTGTSFGFVAGWQYNFENNIGLNFDYAWNGFGDLDSKTLSLGVTFSF